MELYKTLEELSDKVSKLRNHVATEEATKTAFVLPFLVSLGYDIHNPLEVIPEIDCDIRKGDKVNYAINIGFKPAMIVECKQCEKSLDVFVLQLAKYYVTTKVRFAILTNGIEYCFFSDMDRTNLMDSKPFSVFDISSFDKHDVELIASFEKYHYTAIKHKKPQINRKSEITCLQLVENLRNRKFSGTPMRRLLRARASRTSTATTSAALTAIATRRRGRSCAADWHLTLPRHCTSSIRAISIISRSIGCRVSASRSR